MIDAADVSKTDDSEIREWNPQRSDFRYSFIAKIEVLDGESGNRMVCATSNVSRYGCHVKTLTPLLPDTAVKLKITYGGGVFESLGKVVYAIAGEGMGIHFGDVSAQGQILLKEWLTEIGAKELEQRLRNKPQPRVVLTRLDKLLLVACVGGLAALIFAAVIWLW
jgi:hypothetical protein